MVQKFIAGWSSLVARRAHNPKVIGSNPIPATKYIKGFKVLLKTLFLFLPPICPPRVTDTQNAISAHLFLLPHQRPELSLVRHFLESLRLHCIC